MAEPASSGVGAASHRPGGSVNPQDRLQPFLLDRLLDEEPNLAQDRPERRMMTERRFRQSVLRDLAWLLNSKAHPEWDGLGEFEQASRSVLNYGLPDITGMTETHSSAAELERMVRSAILQFEPRIVRSTLVVRVIDAGRGGPGGTGGAGGPAGPAAPGHSIVLEIKGDIRVHPMSAPIYLKTKLDLETGHCEIQE